MEFPVIFEFGFFKLQAHLLFEVLAFFIGFRYFLWLRRKQEDVVGSYDRIWIIVGAAAGALIGSRLLGGLEQPEIFFSGETSLLYYYENKTIVGGLLGGLIGVETIKKFIGVKSSSGDLFTFPLILAIMLGRIGCFLAGTTDGTHGLETTLPWGMDLGDGLIRHPAALYEIGFLLLLWIVLRALRKRFTLANGALFKLFMMAYLGYRFGVEFIKPGWHFSFGLTSIQLACALGLTYYLAIVRHPRRLLATSEPKSIAHA